MKDRMGGGVCFIVSCLAPYSRIYFWTTGGGGVMRQLFKFCLILYYISYYIIIFPRCD